MPVQGFARTWLWELRLMFESEKAASYLLAKSRWIWMARETHRLRRSWRPHRPGGWPCLPKTKWPTSWPTVQYACLSQGNWKSRVDSPCMGGWRGWLERAPWPMAKTRSQLTRMAQQSSHPYCSHFFTLVQELVRVWREKPKIFS